MAISYWILGVVVVARRLIMRIQDAPSPKIYKRERIRDLVLWGYITQPQANRLWRDYLKLYRRVTK